MKSRVFTLVMMAVMTVGAVAGVASAQWNQRHWRKYTKKEVGEIIKNVETSADHFRKDFDRWLDHSRFDGKTREDRFNSKVKNFERATDRLRAEFDKKDSWWETKTEVEQVMAEARPVAQMMRNNNFGPDLEKQWARLRNDLNKLASTYQLPYLR